MRMELWSVGGEETKRDATQKLREKINKRNDGRRYSVTQDQRERGCARGQVPVCVRGQVPRSVCKIYIFNTACTMWGLDLCTTSV